MNKKVQENITTLHKDISFNGKLVGDEKIIISGHMEGILQTSQDLTIEKSGIVKADIKSANLVLRGTLVGNVDSKGIVTITKSGRMIGDIKSENIIINIGGQYKGTILNKANRPHKESPRKNSRSKTKR
tara:strand:- start:971 stop:1357 length:387 start_codon:yes stop_codon:yes gene_type:complete